jgi:2'-5' RNA ligase
MDEGVWVELAFTGDVPEHAADAFTGRVDGFARRFGLRLATGTTFPGGERPWPGTALLLDLAIQRLAGELNLTPQAVQADLEDRAQRQLNP